jgi:uncharacterized protein YjbJ (UPF0337 family)
MDEAQCEGLVGSRICRVRAAVEAGRRARPGSKRRHVGFEIRKETPIMDENRVAGSIEEFKGAAKMAIGQATGDAKLQSDGEADKAVGKIQNAASGFSDAVRDTEAMKSAGLLYSPGPRLQRA